MKRLNVLKKALVTSVFLVFAAPLLALAAIPSDPEAATKGVFGPVISWPIIPIHWTLLPDGRILSFGSDTRGFQGALVHDIWNPSLGTAPASHVLVPNVVKTDLFCAAQALIPSTGETLITGGDTTVAGERNFGSPDSNLFNYKTNTMVAGKKMAFKRWYPTLVTLPDGSMVILGGRDDKKIPTYATTPELYFPGIGFKALTGATSDAAFGNPGNLAAWNYPRGFLAPNGRIFIANYAGNAFWLTTSGVGTITKIPGVFAIGSAPYLPSVMYSPGRVFSIRNGKKVALFDARTSNVTIRHILGLSHPRILSSATVMADGKIFINGGSSVYNVLKDVAHQSEIWNPNTEKFTLAALNNPNIARLYHSNALLLPDATVLTGGGGAPGPQTNKNAEVYYPPYLYNADGTPAIRPTITKAPDTITWNQSLDVSFNTASPITKVAFVRAGSATHDLNVEQRFIQLQFTAVTPTSIKVVGPKARTTSPPGYYLLFVFNKDGVPSVAKIINLK